MTVGPRTPDELDEVARLLSVPLPAFVEERKRLAAALKSLGRRDEAQQIAKLAKPSVAVWVVNQLARSEGPLLQRLGEVSGAMRTAPRRPREGARHDDAGSDYAGLLAQHRETLRALRAVAERVLAASQLGASPAVLERITHTLRAGMADDETRVTILQGRLLRDVGDVDFADLVGAGVGASPGASGPSDDEPARVTRVPAPPPPTKAAAAAAAEERTRAREAAARQRERERAHAAAEREVEQRRAKADTARQRVAAEERTVAAARRALADGEKRLAEAQGEADEATRALEAAEETARGLAPNAAPARE